MGNKLGRRRQIVDERYTKPQGLYHHRDVDHKKLKKLILDSKLAPCYPGDDDCTYDLEDCPICFLYYPSLNRSRCCMKGICTECFLQLKNPNSAAPTQCPFCKASNYAVEYRGVKSKAERGLEHVEEQRVIEAKIRMMRQIHDEEEKKKGTPTAAPAHDGGVLLSSEEPPSLIIASSVNARGSEFELDVEEIMLMEAIWHSVQEQGQDVKYHQQGDVIHSSLTVNHHHTPLVLGGSSTFEEQVMLATALSLTDSHHVPTCH